MDASQSNAHIVQEHIYNAIIVGGGFAGAAAAAVLGRRIGKIAVVDLHETFPFEYRAEKIGGEQIAQLRRLGLLDAILPRTTSVKNMVNMRGGMLVDRREVNEFGIFYHEMVAALRSQIPADVEQIIGRVADIETSAASQTVTLADGRRLKGRLVILATGVSDAIRRNIGVTRTIVQKNQCFTAGWSVTPPATGFPVPALTCYSNRSGDGVDYVSFFPIGDIMRANFFMFADPRHPVIARFKADAMDAISSLIPGLRDLLADCALSDGPNLYSVDLYRCDNVHRDGIVLIGDAFRTSCPAVGSGLTCALNDIECLADIAPHWFETAGMDRMKIAHFYDNPAKTAQDAKAHALARARRQAATDTGLLNVSRRNIRFAARVVRDRLYHIGKEPSPRISKAS